MSASQIFVDKPTRLLENGVIKTPGYSTHMNFIYDNRTIRTLRLKEWDFYQINCGDFVVQIVIGNVSYAAQVSATVLNLKTGQRKSLSKLTFNTRKIKKAMPSNPEKPCVLQWFDPEIKAQFEVANGYRRLTLSQWDKTRVRAEIDVTLTNAAFSKEKMVIATPMEKGWYLNYKENCFVANGYCRIEDVEVNVVNGFGLLDWGRGIWPYKHSWVWGNGSTVVDGKFFGFNIGWGFGDTSAATENMFFYDNKAYKLGEVREIKVGDDFRYTDKEKKFVFKVKRLYDNYTHTKMLWVNNSCHQVFGLWSGEVTFPDGKKLKIPAFTAFCEHADNRW